MRHPSHGYVSLADPKGSHYRYLDSCDAAWTGRAGWKRAYGISLGAVARPVWCHRDLSASQILGLGCRMSGMYGCGSGFLWEA